MRGLDNAGTSGTQRRSCKLYAILLLLRLLRVHISVQLNCAFSMRVLLMYGSVRVHVPRGVGGRELQRRLRHRILTTTPAFDDNGNLQNA